MRADPRICGKSCLSWSCFRLFFGCIECFLLVEIWNLVVRTWIPLELITAEHPFMCLLTFRALVIDFIYCDIIVEFLFCDSFLHVTDLAKVCKAGLSCQARSTVDRAWRNMEIASLVHVDQIYIKLWLILINSHLKGLLRPLSLSWLSSLRCRWFIFSKVICTTILSANLWRYTAFQQRLTHRISYSADLSRRLWFRRYG